VRSSRVSLVVSPVHRVVEEGSPEFTTAPNPRRRVDRSPRCPSAVAAAPTSLASSRASRRSHPRPNPWPKTLDWVPPASSAALRRRSRSPPALPRRRPHARVLRRRIKPTHLVQPAAPLNPLASAAVGFRSNGSKAPNPGQYWSTRPVPVILQENP
jgi:hypothetical protein